MLSIEEDNQPLLPDKYNVKLPECSFTFLNVTSKNGSPIDAHVGVGVAHNKLA